ncbi:MAG: phage tail protein, partial [Rhodobacterales bacterium]
MSPQVIVGAAVSGLATGLVSGGLAAGLKALAVSALVGGVSYAMQRRGMNDKTPAMGQTIKDPVAPRRVIYGERRVSGTLIHLATTNDDKLIHMLIALAGHEVDEISDVWLNDNPIEHYAKYGRKPWRRIQWSAGHSGWLDLSSLSVTVNGQQHTGTIDTLLSELSARGFIVSGDAGDYEISDGVYQKSATLEITVAELDDLLTINATNGIVRDRIADDMPVLVRTGYGAPDQIAHPDLIAEMPEWTEDHRLQGVAWVYVRLRYDYRAFPAGLPAVTALVRGKNDIYDPRSDSAGYTTNPALCVADYLHNSRYGLGAAYGSEINPAALIAAANICDEVVQTQEGSEPRYSCHGVLGTGADPKSNLEALLSSMTGTAVYTGGFWTIRAGAWELPTITLDERHLRGPLRMQTRLSRPDMANGVKGVFADPGQDYQPADFPAVTSSAYLAEDGERVWQDIILDYTTSPSQAQRIAKIILEQARRGISLHYPCSIAALGITAGSTVAISNSRYGWVGKTFRVIGWELAIDADGLLGVDLQLRETDAGVYSWADAEDIPTLPPVPINQPRPWYVGPVVNLTAIMSDQTAADGRIIPAILVSFGAPATPVDHYRVELWIADSDTLLTSLQTSEIDIALTGVTAGVLYRVRVVAVNRLGAESMASVVQVGVTDAQAASPYVYAEVIVYTRTDSAPATPVGGHYNFNTSTLTPPDGWGIDVPTAGTGTVYESTATAKAPGGVGSDNNLEWSEPVVSVGAMLAILSG